MDRSANTTPGNKKGGLSNIVEKAMGSIVKSGSAPIVGVLSPCEKLQTRGLTYAATPASGLLRPARPFVLRPASAADRQRALRCLTQGIYYEAALEPTEGQEAVAQVILNRVRDLNYPNSICGVVFEGADRTTGCQFRFTCMGALAQAPVGWAWKRSQTVAERMLSGHVATKVGTATHYHADYVHPWWATTLNKLTQIGAHIFYRWKGMSGETSAFRQAYSGREPVIDEARLSRPRLQLVATDEAALAEVGKAPVKLVLSQPRDRIQWVNALRADPVPHLSAEAVPAALVPVRDALAARDLAAARAALAQARPGRPWIAGHEAAVEVLAEGLLSVASDDEGGIISRGPGQTDEVFRLRAISHSLQQAFERYFIAITTLVKNGPRTLSAGELESLCHLTAQRLSLLYAPAAPEFFDKSLFRGFIQKLREMKLVWVGENGKLDFDEQLMAWEKDAKVVLGRDLRHTISKLSPEAVSKVAGAGVANAEA